MSSERVGRAPAHHTEPVVAVTEGRLRGTFDNTIAVFRGIPYAAPPSGPLRFAAPQPPRPWAEVRDAVEFGPNAPQPAMFGAAAPAPPTRTDPDEWLTLNVWSPDLSASGLPVMVWIHGGGYNFGSSAAPWTDGRVLATRGVVLVAINYRLGLEGFGHVMGAPANRGLLDQVAALQWIRRNIAAFGGDGDNITVVGVSSGGGAALALMAMPAARGLFQRVIAQSPALHPFTQELAADISATIATELGTAATGNALAQFEPRALIEATRAVQLEPMPPRWGRAGQTGWLSLFAPIIDGTVLPEDPYGALTRGVGREIDLLIGHTRDEASIFIQLAGGPDRITPQLTEQLLDESTPAHDAYRNAYPDLDFRQLHEVVLSDSMLRMPTIQFAKAHTRGGGRTHLYELRYDRTPIRAGHTIDIPLVFGNFDAAASQQVYGMIPAVEALRLAENMQTDWRSFAATGDPGWPVYRTDTQPTRCYDNDDVHTRGYPETTSQQIWNGYLSTSACPLLDTGAT